MIDGAITETTPALYRLKIEYDDYPLNPRTEFDNFGKMVCWHSRYDLGDKHDFSEPSEFLKRLVQDTLTADEVISYVKNGGCDTVKFEYDRSKDEWTLKDLYDGKWFYGYTFNGGELNGSELARDAVLEVLPAKNLKELADKRNIILPLYLYDHSGITISCSHEYPYNDRWDAGQVGWIYAGYGDIQKEYGAVNSETLKKVENLLISETKTYDDYLRGECYGYIIEKNGVDVDSCWGFLGDLRDMISEMKSGVDKEYQRLFDHVDYGCMEYTETQEPKKSVREQLKSLKATPEKAAPEKAAPKRSEPEI